LAHQHRSGHVEGIDGAPMTQQLVIDHAVPAPAAVRSRNARRHRTHARTHLSAGRGTYLVLAAVVAVSAFPVYYTFVMASHTNAEMASATPPLLPTLNIFDNLREALKLAPL